MQVFADLSAAMFGVMGKTLFQCTKVVGFSPKITDMPTLFFGFANNLQGNLSIIGVPIPSEFMLMVPYVATIIAVSCVVGRVRAPAADGIPYSRGNK